MTRVEPATRGPASLQRRVLGIAGGAFLAVSALLGFTTSIVLDLRAALEEQRSVLVPSRRLLADYDVAVREQQRGERGFVITADPAFVTIYENGDAVAAVTHAGLVRQLAKDPEGLRLLDAAEDAHQGWADEAATPAIDAVRNGDMAAAAATVATLGRPRFERFQATLADLEAHVDARIEAGEVELAEAEDRLLKLLGGAGLSALAILALVLAALERWVIAPVERLSGAVREVAAGDLSRAVSVEGPREVVSLAADVEGMRLRIVAELEEMRRANEALEQQAPLVLGLREVLLPEISAPPTVELASLFLPAEGVLAGDWFDVWALDDERIALVVVDISGHGADAGLFALRIKDLLVSSVAIFPQPGDALGWVAERLGDTGERFATIFLALLDPGRGRMAYASAGHPAVYLASPSSIVTLLPTGSLLGPIAGRWDTRTVMLDAGTMVVCSTDGLIEARAASGEEFGSSRLLDLVTDMRDRRPKELVDRCKEELAVFAAGRFQDDVTLVAAAMRAP